jgi:glycosyltransferase involved in cell wall biosynthesis
MKMLHVIIGLDIGGAELALKRLIDADSNNKSAQHCVVSLTSLGKVGQQLQSTGTRVYALGLRGVLRIPAVFWHLIGLLRREQPDVVQTWMYHADLIGGLAARLAGFRNVVWNIRNTLIPQRRWSRTQFVVQLCAKLSHWVPRRIVCCAEAARSIHVEMGYAAEKMIFIPNGYDLSAFCITSEHKQQIREKLGFSQDVVVIGIVGRFDPLKDYPNFVCAAMRVGAARPHARFLMVRGCHKRSTKKLASKHRLSRSFCFTRRTQ